MRGAVFPKQQGLTLIEMIITIVILSAAVVGVVSAIASMTARGADPIVQNKAALLAQFYLDEALGTRYDEASPITGGEVSPVSQLCNAMGPESESRAAFDDVDDYHNLSESPRDRSGAALSGYAGFHVEMKVTCDGSRFGMANHAAKHISVTVTPPQGAAMVFGVYRGYF